MSERERLAWLQVLGENPVARTARRVFDACARGSDHCGCSDERNGQLRCECRAVRGPLRAAGVQAVVDMQCPQPAFARRRERREGMQQHAGIKTATETDYDGAGQGPNFLG
jgi:hypothetical protein